MEDIINQIINNGMGVVIMAYFLFKDYKFNEQIIKTLEGINDVLIGLRERIYNDLQS